MYSIVYAGTCGAGVFKSTDGGASWKPSNEGLDDVIVWALAIDPQSPSTLYAATAGRGVYKSLDEGQTWFPANTGLSSSPQGIEAIVIDPTNTSLLHACDAWIGMVRSTDAGEHWTVVEVNGASFFCTSLAITATSPPTLYAGSVGVIQSQDGGTSWTALNDGLTNSLVKALAVDPAGSAVHAGTMVDGVFDYTTAPPAPCVASATTACLHGGRYAVRATYATSDRSLDAAHVMQLTDDSTAFWFFLPANLEAFLKVIDGCSVNGHIWVFAAGLTDVEAGLFVTDTQSGIVRSYFNPSRTPFEPAQDIRAFACDTPPPSPASPRRASAAPPGGGMEAPAAGTCRPNATTLCLGNGRFAVNTTFRTPFGLTGQGMAVPLTFDTGYFWFFDAANLEVMVKVLDACSLFGRFWVFAGGLTNLEVTTTVTDTLTGYSKSYVNPWGTAFRPVQDTGFLACAAHAPRAAPVPRRPMVP